MEIIDSIPNNMGSLYSAIRLPGIELIKIPLEILNCFAFYLLSSIFHKFPTLGYILSDTEIHLVLWIGFLNLYCHLHKVLPACNTFHHYAHAKYMLKPLALNVFVGKEYWIISSLMLFCFHPSVRLLYWIIIAFLDNTFLLDFKLFSAANVVIIFISPLF